MENGFIRYSKRGFVNMSRIVSGEIYSGELSVKVLKGETTYFIRVDDEFIKEWCDRFDLEFPKEKPLPHSKF
jgi:hypothetical protein